VGATALALGALAAVPSLAPAKAKGPNAKGPYTCSGTQLKPGVLAAGTYKSGVIVKGVCLVNDGPAKVLHTLDVRKGSVLGAAYGMNNSSLTVKGNVKVGPGATVDLGCGTPDSPCIDAPMTPSVKSHGMITGNLISTKPLGVIVHLSTIGGNVIETGGGGGLSCNPPFPFPFSLFNFPVYSAYDSNTINGNVEVSGLKTCWLGVNENTVKGKVKLLKNDLADPDGIEVLNNTIHKDLVCKKNIHPAAVNAANPGTFPVWDSADQPPAFLEYPRTPGVNTVHGKRFGQCARSTPTTLNGPLGAPGSF
jgi:hypothetical protein